MYLYSTKKKKDAICSYSFIVKCKQILNLSNITVRKVLLSKERNFNCKYRRKVQKKFLVKSKLRLKTH